MFDIVHLLTGDSAFPPSLDSMVDSYLTKRKFDFEQVAWYGHYVDRDRVIALIDSYEALPEQARLHFLFSPAIYEAVHTFGKHSDAAALDKLIRFAQDELAFANGEPTPAHKARKEDFWSPLGDQVFRHSDDGWVLQREYKLDSVTLVDFKSPQVTMLRTESPVMFRPHEDLTPMEEQALIIKMELALAYVDRVAPTFGRMIRNYTRAIRVRKCERVNGFSSEHVTNTIGEIRILNAHRDEYPMTKMAETLIHETVHNLLSTYEYLNQPFVFGDTTKQYRPVSPWTGNPIPVASFNHAVFVWFSLFQFAQRELAQPDLTDVQRKDILRRRNQYASGFMIPTPMSDCLRGLATLHHGIMPTIDALQTLVRASIEHGLEATPNPGAVPLFA